MSLKKIILLFALIQGSVVNSFSQDVCGTSLETQETLVTQPNVLRQRNSTVYVPLRIHMVADNEGNGLPNISKLLDQMTRLNQDYLGTGIQFYMAGSGFFNFIKDINVYEAPSINVQDILGYKSSTALNVFVTKNTYEPTGEGRILGYYTGLGADHIVMLNSQLSNSNNTLSHEVGHFFNLRHTFFGWEREPYSAATHGNPLSIRIAPLSSIPVELMDKSNCSTAADQVCDTPPDFNFGFNANGCNFTQQIRDPNNELVVTQKENQMSYFNNCAKYLFTEGQTTRMNNSLQSNSRSYIRLPYVPTTTPITQLPSFIDLAAVVPTYNNVFIQWTPVEGATNYLVEFTDGRSYRYAIQNGSSIRARDLEANKTYFVRVRAFNEYFTDTRTLFGTFKTGNILSSVINNENDRFSIDLLGNPINKQSEFIQFNVNSTMSFPAALKLYDVNGRLIHIESTNIESGSSLFRIPASNLNTGLHILAIESEYGITTKKILIN
jgi:hypothetical protein